MGDSTRRQDILQADGLFYKQTGDYPSRWDILQADGRSYK